MFHKLIPWPCNINCAKIIVSRVENPIIVGAGSKSCTTAFNINICRRAIYRLYAIDSFQPTVISAADCLQKHCLILLEKRNNIAFVCEITIARSYHQEDGYHNQYDS